MPHDPLHIASVDAMPDQRLRLAFEDGFIADVDLSDWIANTRALSGLADPALFSQARVGEWGTSVVWVAHVLDLGADNLRHLAVEQAGCIGAVLEKATTGRRLVLPSPEEDAAIATGIDADPDTYEVPTEEFKTLRKRGPQA